MVLVTNDMHELEQLLDMLRRAGIERTFADSGCTAESITAFESAVGLSLPDDYRRFLLRHDGQAQDAQVLFPPGQLLFLPLDEVLTLWQELLEFEDLEFFDEAEDHDRVRAVVYHRQRVPIAYYDLGTQYIFLDFIPGPRGKPGQLIFNPNECDFYVIADTFTELLATYVQLVHSGAATVCQIPADLRHGYWFTSGDPRHSLSIDPFLRSPAG